MSWLIVDDVFTSEEIKTMCGYFDTHASLVDGTVGTELKKDSGVRSSQVCMFDRRNENTNWIFKKIDLVINQLNKEYFKFKLTGYKQLQYAVYKDVDNGHYEFHSDTIKHFNVDKTNRKLSLSLLLSEPEIDFSGGELLFNISSEKYAKKISIRKGSMVIFPSYLLHAVSPVTKGTRKSLVVWVEGPNFI